MLERFQHLPSSSLLTRLRGELAGFGRDLFIICLYRDHAGQLTAKGGVLGWSDLQNVHLFRHGTDWNININM